MTKKKNKNKVQENPLKLQAKHKLDYISRLKMVCDKLVGYGWFEFIPSRYLDDIYENRYPPLTIKMAPGAIIDSARWQEYRKTLSSLLDVPAIPMAIENTIPIKTMLSEGLTLLHFVAIMAKNRFPRSEELRQILRPFLMPENVYYSYLSDQLSGLLFLMDVRSGNYQDGFLQADKTQTNIHRIAAANTLVIHLYKPILSSAVIEGDKREIVAVTRPVPNGITLQVKFKPSAIGLTSTTDEALPVYIQRHALRRLDERLGLQANNVHSHLFFSMFEQPVNFVLHKGRSLIEFNMYEHKVGYLVTTLHEDKLVILTFLFLTNDGTPEGRRLGQLTGLEKHDKKYLGIDKLSTFTAYKIHEDEELSALFHEAGCGSLLDARILQEIAAEYMPERNKATLHKYISVD